MKLDRYLKAIVAALGAGFLIYQKAKGFESPAGEGVTFNEWVDALISALGAGILIYAVPNAKAAPVAGETPDTPLHVELEPDSAAPVVDPAATTYASGRALPPTVERWP